MYKRQGDKRYVFVVDRRANKVEIKKAVESIFDVQVAKVNTVTTTGKVKRMGRSEAVSYTHLLRGAQTLEEQRGLWHQLCVSFEQFHI